MRIQLYQELITILNWLESSRGTMLIDLMDCFYFNFKSFQYWIDQCLNRIDEIFASQFHQEEV